MLRHRAKHHTGSQESPLPRFTHSKPQKRIPLTQPFYFSLLIYTSTMVAVNHSAQQAVEKPNHNLKLQYIEITHALHSHIHSKKNSNYIHWGKIMAKRKNYTLLPWNARLLRLTKAWLLKLRKTIYQTLCLSMKHLV